MRTTATIVLLPSPLSRVRLSLRGHTDGHFLELEPEPNALVPQDIRLLGQLGGLENSKVFSIKSRILQLTKITVLVPSWDPLQPIYIYIS